MKLTFANETLPDENMIDNVPAGRHPSMENPNPLWIYYPDTGEEVRRSALQRREPVPAGLALLHPQGDRHRYGQRPERRPRPGVRSRCSFRAPASAIPATSASPEQARHARALGERRPRRARCRTGAASARRAQRASSSTAIRSSGEASSASARSRSVSARNDGRIGLTDQVDNLACECAEPPPVRPRDGEETRPHRPQQRLRLDVVRARELRGDVGELPRPRRAGRARRASSRAARRCSAGRSARPSR